MNDEDKLYLKALNLSYFYLNFRPRTYKEIEEYLQKKAAKFKFDEKTISKAIKSLQQDNLINDQKFIEWFVEIKTTRRPISKFLIKQKLLKHGVEKQLIDEYLEKNTVDELKLAKIALEKRWLRFKNLPKKEKFQKTASFLGRRGFSYDIIKKTIAEFGEKD